MLQWFVIGSAPMEFSRRLKYIAAFLPKLDNWSVCDSFCTSLKATKEHMEEMWEFILPRMSCGREYEIRFAVVLMLNYYISEDYLNEALSLLVSVSHDGYYVKMGVAWALSMYYVRFPQQVLPVLTQGLVSYTHLPPHARVRRAVVNHNQLYVLVRLCRHRFDCAANIVFVVIGWNNDGNQRLQDVYKRQAFAIGRYGSSGQISS